MATDTKPGRVNVGEFAGKQFLLDLDRAERAEFYKLLDEAPWEGKTASGHWQTRDLCGHMIDVTEGYLERFALARARKEFPEPLGLPIMASKLDEGAQRFRSLSKPDAIARLKTASDKMFEIFEALDEKSWSGEIVPHTFMGPLPAYFFAAFQLLDYSIHSWDAKAGLGRDEPLSDAAAVTLIPFMFIVLQYTVDAQRAADLRAKFGVEITGPGGGSWSVDVEGTAVTINEGSTEGAQTVFTFEPSEFCLSIYQRMRGGTVSGDAGIGERVRDLLFKI
jgi:uncharacterized protein (TIGR03083 family)